MKINSGMYALLCTILSNVHSVVEFDQLQAED